MFNYFDDKFKKDSRSCNKGNNAYPYPADMAEGLCHLFKNYGGDSFNGGLYRIVKPEDIKTWSERVCQAFPDYEKTTVCFGYDWLGSRFLRRMAESNGFIIEIQ